MPTEYNHEPHLAAHPSRLEAEEFIRSLVSWVGPGFHPDTDFNDYVNGITGIRSFSPSQAELLNIKLDLATTALKDGGDDVYEIAAPVQHALLQPFFSKSSLVG